MRTANEQLAQEKHEREKIQVNHVYHENTDNCTSQAELSTAVEAAEAAKADAERAKACAEELRGKVRFPETNSFMSVIHCVPISMENDAHQNKPSALLEKKRHYCRWPMVSRARLSLYSRYEKRRSDWRRSSRSWARVCGKRSDFMRKYVLKRCFSASSQRQSSPKWRRRRERRRER